MSYPNENGSVSESYLPGFLRIALQISVRGPEAEQSYSIQFKFPKQAKMPFNNNNNFEIAYLVTGYKFLKLAYRHLTESGKERQVKMQEK